MTGGADDESVERPTETDMTRVELAHADLVRGANQRFLRGHVSCPTDPQIETAPLEPC